MGILLIISAIAAGGIVFLIYFGFALWRDAGHAQKKRVLVLKLRQTIARKRHQPRLLYMQNLRLIASTRANEQGSYDPEKCVMQDLIFVATTIAFFAISIAYVHFCERVK